SSRLNIHYSFLEYSFKFYFNDTASTQINNLSLHDALPICPSTLDSAYLQSSSPSGPMELATLPAIVTRLRPHASVEGSIRSARALGSYFRSRLPSSITSGRSPNQGKTISPRARSSEKLPPISSPSDVSCSITPPLPGRLNSRRGARGGRALATVLGTTSRTAALSVTCRVASEASDENSNVHGPLPDSTVTRPSIKLRVFLCESATSA